MQTESVAVGFGGKAVIEDAGEIFFGNAGAVVVDFDADPVAIALVETHCADGDYGIFRATGEDGVLGVAEEVDEDLEEGVLVADEDLRA